MYVGYTRRLHSKHRFLFRNFIPTFYGLSTHPQSPLPPKLFFSFFSCLRCIKVVTETHTCRFIGTETCFVPTDFIRQKNSPQYTIASFGYAFVLFIYLFLKRKNWQNEKILFDFKRMTFLVQFCI